MGVASLRPMQRLNSCGVMIVAPVLWADGTGADVMRRLAAPMIGGLGVSFAMELVVYPILFALAKEWQMRAAWKEGHR